MKEGFVRAVYQVVSESAVVKSEPSAPAERQSRQEIISFAISLSFISAIIAELGLRRQGKRQEPISKVVDGRRNLGYCMA